MAYIEPAVNDSPGDSPAAVWSAEKVAFFAGSAANGSVVMIGDSMVANEVGVATAGTNGYSYYYHQRGIVNWMQALCGFPYNTVTLYRGLLPPDDCNQGVGGQETKDMVARFPVDVLSQSPVPPNLVWIRAGTNDIKASQTAETISTNLISMAKMAMDLGVPVIMETIWPRNNSDGNGFSAGEELIRLDVNSRLVAFGNTVPGRCIVLSLDATLIDPATGALNVNYSYDGLHPNSLGAYMVAVNNAIPAWKLISSSTKIYRTYPGDFNTTTAPYGNLLTNGAFTGTGGTASTGVTGTLPTSWRSERSAGSVITAVASIVTEADWNGNSSTFSQHVVTSVGSGADTDEYRLRPTATAITSNIVAGNWYVAEAEVKVTNATARLLRSVYLRVTDQEGDDTHVRMFSTRYTNVSVKDIFPNSDMHLVLRTPPFQLDGTTGILYYMMADFDTTVTGAVTLKWTKPVLKPIPYVPERGASGNVRVVTAAGAITVSGTDDVILVNKNVGAATSVTLPINPQKNRTVAVKDYKGDAGTNNITVTAPLSGTIDNSASNVISSNYGWRTYRAVGNGNNWYVL